MRIIECYKNNKIVYRIELYMNDIDFEKQIKNGILFYDTKDGDTEIINLDFFDKVKIIGETLYAKFRR